MWYDTRPKMTVHVQQTEEEYPCPRGESLLRGMLNLGRKGIPVGCVNGGCGVCKVRILQGKVERLGPISRAHVTLEEEASGCTLACRVTPTTEVYLEVMGKFKKSFHRGHEESSGLNFTKPSSSQKEI